MEGSVGAWVAGPEEWTVNTAHIFMVAYAYGAVFFAAVAAVGASRSEARRLGEDLDMRRLAAAADDGRLGSHLSFKVDLAHRLVVEGRLVEGRRRFSWK